MIERIDRDVDMIIGRTCSGVWLAKAFGLMICAEATIQGHTMKRLWKSERRRS